MTAPLDTFKPREPLETFIVVAAHGAAPINIRKVATMIGQADPLREPAVYALSLLANTGKVEEGELRTTFDLNVVTGSSERRGRALLVSYARMQRE